MIDNITLENIKMYSLEAVFTAVADHMLEQGEPAINDDGDCVYRAGDGSRCAVGFLIDDSLYFKLGKTLEGKAIDNSEFDRFFTPFERAAAEAYYAKYPYPYAEKYDRMEDNKAGLEADPYRKLLKSLQTIHDAASAGHHRDDPRGYWKKELNKLAAEYKFGVQY